MGIKLNYLFKVISIVLCLSQFVLGELVNLNDPKCRDTCFDLPNESKDKCLNEYMKYYSYKLVHSLFDFGKVSIYAGLWANRYEKSDPTLFETIYKRTLENYNNETILGNVKYEDLKSQINYVYSSFKYLTAKRAKNQTTLIPYASYPSLRCPIPCSYELITWQTLFAISLVVFTLTLSLIILYSIFLRKQYLSLRNRIKN